MRLDSVFAATVHYSLAETFSCQCPVERLNVRLIHVVCTDPMGNSASYAAISDRFPRPNIRLLGVKQKQPASRH